MSEEVLPAYDEEQVKKMLADVSQHRPITLAEAIAYHYIDVEDPKLGLANDTVQRIKNLFRPVADESTLNLIRVKRSGEYLTDVNLAETNAFEKLSQTEPFIYQLQQSFEPTLDFNEKQFRSLTETISKNKEEFDQLQFDISRTLLPFDDMKESSNNDFSQSDSGYSMTTATHESLASKIKIEFEPIQSEASPVPPKRDDLIDDSKIDLDKATGEQLDRYELNQDLIQIIKSDFNGSDKVRNALLFAVLPLSPLIFPDDRTGHSIARTTFGQHGPERCLTLEFIGHRCRPSKNTVDVFLPEEYSHDCLFARTWPFRRGTNDVQCRSSRSQN